MKAMDTIIEQLGPFGFMMIQTNLENPLNHKYHIRSRPFPFLNRFGQWEQLPLYYKPKTI